jgi:RHS repeat-associated protein
MRYLYDALGRRVSAYAPTKGKTNFTYDGDDVLLDDANSTLTKYINGPGIDNKLRQTTGSSASYFLADHLGSTNGLTDSTGALTASNSYDSFGNPSSTSFPTRYQFTGREFDSTTGLQFSRARWYDPGIGRFISEDPIGFAAGDINIYAYVWNSPQRYSDPIGLGPFKLPKNPGPGGSNLPKGWKPDTSHKYPNGERWVSPNGDEGLDFHKGRPDKSGLQGEDHWHKLKPNRTGDGLEPDVTGGRRGGHYLPDDEVELDSVDFCALRRPFDLGQPTNEEIRLQIDAANNREAFWTKILVGSVIAGGGYLAPGLIPALIPSLPAAAPQFAY